MKNLKHLAIIMDGNGRWAQERGRLRTFGHIKGARVAKNIITFCAEKKINELTLYAFSTENWARPQEEVAFLMRLLERYIRKERERLVKENIKFKAIGDLTDLDQKISQSILETEKATENNTGLKLNFAINYGGRQEIIFTVKKIIKDIQEQNISSSSVNEELFSQMLMKNSASEPDLIIRTSGELRISNFLTWQSAYSEFYFTSKNWPDFTGKDIEDAILSYFQRDRRYGTIKNQSQIIEENFFGEKI